METKTKVSPAAARSQAQRRADRWIAREKECAQVRAECAQIHMSHGSPERTLLALDMVHSHGGLTLELFEG